MEPHTQKFKEIDARFDVLESAISTIPDEKKIEEIVRKALLDVLFSTGRFTKGFLITAASVVVALGILTGAWKYILAWLGYVSIK